MTAVSVGQHFMQNPNYRRFELPWTRIEEEARRFRNALVGVMGVLLILSVIIPFLPATKVQQHTAQDIPPRLAKFVLEKKIAPPPPPPEIVKEEPAEVVAPIVAEKPRPVPVPVIQPEPRTPVVGPPPPQATVEQARAKAKSVGLLAVADDLASLRQNSAVSLTAGRTLSAAVGSSDKTDRSLITSKSGKRSSGVNTAALSRNTGGSGLAGRTTTTVTSPVTLAGSNPVHGPAGGAIGDSGFAAQRSQEEIETIFDRNKAAIYALYRRALRQDPSLQGKLVLQLTIAPSGQVVACSVVSSELNAPEFEQNLVKRVTMFDFGAQDVDEVTTTKPIDFFPA